jgi:hypothetical protein
MVEKKKEKKATSSTVLDGHSETGIATANSVNYFYLCEMKVSRCPLPRTRQRRLLMGKINVSSNILKTTYISFQRRTWAHIHPLLPILEPSDNK